MSRGTERASKKENPSTTVVPLTSGLLIAWQKGEEDVPRSEQARKKKKASLLVIPPTSGPNWVATFGPETFCIQAASKKIKCGWLEGPNERASRKN